MLNDRSGYSYGCNLSESVVEIKGASSDCSRRVSDCRACLLEGTSSVVGCNSFYVHPSESE